MGFVLSGAAETISETGKSFLIVKGISRFVKNKTGIRANGKNRIYGCTDQFIRCCQSIRLVDGKEYEVFLLSVNCYISLYWALFSAG
jgi:hypothetical protein